MAEFDPSAAAEVIEAARTGRALVEPFTGRWPTLDLPTAYSVAAHASALRHAATGANRLGRKIGFTNRTIWERYGVNHPIWGWMYDDTVQLAASRTGLPATVVLAASGTGLSAIVDLAANRTGLSAIVDLAANRTGLSATVDLSRLVQPAVEPEIVLCLARPVRAGATVADVAAAIDWIAFGYEIVHCHYPGWKFQAPDTIIDGGLHGALCVGEPAEPWPTMVDDLASFSLTLARNSEVIDRGAGANVLGSALHAVVHLVEVLDRRGVEAGEIITTGTITDAAPARPGDRYSVEITGLPLAPLTLTCA